MKKIVGLIPARMGSSRFPGKALADICGKPMIYWVYNQARKVTEIGDLYVVTEDIEIFDCCKKLGIKCYLGTKKAHTGAEALSYASREINGDIFLNIQGDEPLIEPDAIRQIIVGMMEDESVYYLGLRSKIKSEEEFVNRNIVKAVVDNEGYALYFSRSPIPYTYDFQSAFRVLGLYGYKAEFLRKFADFPVGRLEKLECGVEMLRVMEKGYKIKLLETEFHTIGVDLPEHIKLVEEKMKEMK